MNEVRGTVRWFGQTWNAPINADLPQVETPVGILCQRCNEHIATDDSGVLIAFGGVDYVTAVAMYGDRAEAHVGEHVYAVVIIDGLPYLPEHRDCFLDSVIGHPKLVKP